MTETPHIQQTPAPGSGLLLHRGDTVTFCLRMEGDRDGVGWIRTNLGNARAASREIIAHTRCNTPLSDNHWHDIPMIPSGKNLWKVTLPLTEAGCFEAKCYLTPSDGEQNIWPAGDNVVLKVNPAATCCTNIIYNAFVRYFGDFKSSSNRDNEYREKLITSLDNEGYTVIPPSGTFRHLIKELDFIIDELGCTILHLLPVHPTPTTYARMGRFGSPYAALSFTDVDPALAEFDMKATPVEQFCELIDEVHRRGARVIMDIAVNHTGWASAIHESHPEWVLRDPGGMIQTPGAWGVVWADLTRLDFSDKTLWHYLADVFLLWCRRGVDGFRCDAGYMIPLEAWKFITASVKEPFPDTIFFLEGLGGPVEVTRTLLGRGNFNWAYSELFQNYDRVSIENYLQHASEISANDGLLVHFAETHDNNRLAARSTEWAKMRVALCALASFNGSYGFANGVEWYAREKIDVHEPASLNWGSRENMVSFIKRLNTIIKLHSAFAHNASLRFIRQKQGSCLILLRVNPITRKRLIVAICLETNCPTEARWKPTETGISKSSLHDMITGDRIDIDVDVNTDIWTLKLSPGQVLCLTPDEEDIFLSLAHSKGPHTRVHADKQRVQAKALEVISFYRGMGDISDIDLTRESEIFKKDPWEFCRRHNTLSGGTGTTEWAWPEDSKREVMVPHRQFLLVMAPHRFSAHICQSGAVLSSEASLRGLGNRHFILFSPRVLKEGKARLDLTLFSTETTDRISAPLVFLPEKPPETIRTFFKRDELRTLQHYFLLTNKRGAMVRPNIGFGNLFSKYDTLLGANLSPFYPEDRRIMLSRCRIWVIRNDFSQEVTAECLESFFIDHTLSGNWEYRIPVGNHNAIRLTMRLSLAEDQNEISIHLFRKSPEGTDISDPVSIVVRPDIEDRNFHMRTRADKKLEAAWSEKTSARECGFVFSPSGSWSLQMEGSRGEFHVDEVWTYGIDLPVEASRGLDSQNDLFSPGYFVVPLHPNSGFTLAACANNHRHPHKHSLPTCPVEADGARLPALHMPAGEFLKRAMTQYMTHRGRHTSVIAGYPWFLDWGRDTLIFSRALIQAGMVDEALSIVRLFAGYEKSGTLPNMIAGAHPANRDTSDAPLLFITVCRELHGLVEESVFLSDLPNGRSLRSVLFSIAGAIVGGTPGGVYMDPASCLVFSPSHFTWMDTDAPACTPREGYCIEIQAFWHNALQFLARIDPTEKQAQWHDMTRQIRHSIETLFFIKEKGYFADCLHAPPGTAAHQAKRDDALRPNQLFALTLGAVEDMDLRVQAMESCEKLLIPGGIRSLADRPVTPEHEIIYNGTRINDPSRPYRGTYTGDENTSRKPAYHNGTAWTWLFPLFCEAWFITFGERGRAKARSLLSSSFPLLERGCIGHIPEIMDGNYPHLERGCDAQAWGVSELFRVWALLEAQDN